MEIFCIWAGMLFWYAHSPWLLLIPTAFPPLRKLPLRIGCFVAAFLYAFVHHWMVSPHDMPATDVVARAELAGKVVSVPAVRQGNTRFVIDASLLDNRPVSARVAVYCHGECPAIHAQDTVSVLLRLRKPQSAGNPGSFDYQQYLASQHISWTGSVSGRNMRVISSTSGFRGVLALRESMAIRIAALFGDSRVAGIVQALTIGVTGQIPTAWWDVFRHTGTTHLMVISGAHIGLVSWMVFGSILAVWSRFSLSLIVPAVRVASMGAVISAIGYTLLAGSGAPAVRALVACLCVSFRYLRNRRFSAWQAWRFGLLANLILEPHVVRSAGFYLSFLAVAILLVAAGRLPRNRLLHWVGLQCACLVGMLPSTLYWFGYGALSGLVANLVAIPWVGFVVLPLAFLAAMTGTFAWGSRVILSCEKSVNMLLTFLQWVDGFSWLNLQGLFPSWPRMLLMMLAVVMLTVLSLRPLVLPSLLILGGAIPGQRHAIPDRQVRVDVLDVGQGLSVVLRTRNHVLVYDTGPRYWGGGDAGKSVIVPYLQQQGISGIDTIVVSHPDSDHRGGLDSLYARFPAQALYVDAPLFYGRGMSCHDTPPWNWDGVQFAFMPSNKHFADKNNRSCVLRVSAGQEALLLPGDIESQAESLLIRAHGEALQSTMLVLPHHGSKTSSTDGFLQAVSPRYAVISAGFDNPWHFPHRPVVHALQQRGITMFDTPHCGMTTWVLGKPGDIPRCHRVLNTN